MNLSGQWVISAALAVFLLVVTGILHLATRHMSINPKQRRRVRKVSRYGAVLFLAVVLAVVWAEQLRVGAFVISAFAVAIVLATKETLLCVQGWWLKIAGGHFRTGDRVQIGAWKGDVVDYGLLTTTLLEVQATDSRELRSGGTVTIPNSMLMNEPVRNETRALPFNWHDIIVVVPRGGDWQASEAHLLVCAQEEWEQYEEQARSGIESLEDSIAQSTGDWQPRVLVSQSADGAVHLRLRLGVPVRDVAITEDRIVRRYLAQVRLPSA